METIDDILKDIDELADEYRRRVEAGELPELRLDYQLEAGDRDNTRLHNHYSANQRRLRC